MINREEALIFFHNVIRSRLFKIAISLISTIFLLSIFFWVAEVAYHEDTFTVFDAIEAILVFTLSGFDADPPFTLWGWFFAIMALLFGILFIAAFTAEVVVSRQKKDITVRDVEYKGHVIISGNLADAEYFFEQLFHPDHGDNHLKVVFLMPSYPSPQLESLISLPEYKHRVKYIIGNPILAVDLVRANAAYASSAFVFANRFAMNQDKEDAKTILRSLSMRSFNKNLVTYVQLLQAKNKVHLSSTSVDNYLCIDELSLNLLSQTCINPGLTDLITNLINTSDEEVNEEQPKWVQEFVLGAGREIYKTLCGPASFDMTFSDLAASIHHHYGVTAIAVERAIDGSNTEFAVNPGKEWIMELGDYLFIIADDFDEAEAVLYHKGEFTLPEENFPKNHEEEKKTTPWKGEKIPKEKAILKEVSFKDHIVICGSARNLPLVIAPLRSPDLLHYQRIVVLNPDPLPEKTCEILEQFNEIYFVQGSPLDYSDLQSCGIAKASKVLILNSTGTVETEDNVMVDSDTIMTVMGVAAINRHIYSIAELMYSSNIHFVKPHIADKTIGSDNVTVDEVVTLSHIADSLICQAFYTTNFLDIFEELFRVDTHDEDEERNTCEIYQIALPTFFHDKSYELLFQYLTRKYDVVPVGLYRENDEGERYVFTAPPKDTPLRSSDKIYVFAPDEPEV